MKNSIPTDQFSMACRLFLERAYPAQTVPAGKQVFQDYEPAQPIEPLLVPPICREIGSLSANGRNVQGYAFRLGSIHFPHVKLQILWHGEIGEWLFSVDTHDAVILAQNDPDLPKLREIQEKNRQLKQDVERAWESAGLMTFNSSMRRELQAP